MCVRKLSNCYVPINKNNGLFLLFVCAVMMLQQNNKNVHKIIDYLVFLTFFPAFQTLIYEIIGGHVLDYLCRCCKNSCYNEESL